MIVRKFSIDDGSFERAPGQDGDLLLANVVGQCDGRPVTIGYGRWAAGQTLASTIEVDDVIIPLEGRMTTTPEGRSTTAGPGEIVYMPEGETVTIRTHEAQVVTAYVTHPHCNQSCSH